MSPFFLPREVNDGPSPWLSGAATRRNAMVVSASASGTAKVGRFSLGCRLVFRDASYKL